MYSWITSSFRRNKVFIIFICIALVLCITNGITNKSNKGILDVLSYTGPVQTIPVYWLNEHGVPSGDPESILVGTGLTYTNVMSSITSHFYNMDSNSFELLFTGIGLSNSNQTSGDLFYIVKNADETWDGGPRNKDYKVLCQNVRYYDHKTFDMGGTSITYIVWSDPNITNNPIRLEMITNNGIGVPQGYSINIKTLPLAGQSNIEPSVLCDQDGNPIVTWVANSNGTSKIAFSWWNNNAWRDSAGNEGFEYINIPAPYGNAAKAPSITAVEDDLYINFIDMGTESQDVFLIKSSPQGWTNIDGSSISPLFPMIGNARSTKLHFNPINIQPCVLFIDGLDSKIYFAQYTGGNWVGMTDNAIAPEVLFYEKSNALDADFDFIDSSDSYQLFYGGLKDTSIQKIHSTKATVSDWFAPYKARIISVWLDPSDPANLEYICGRYYDPLTKLWHEWGPTYHDVGTGWDSDGHLIGGYSTSCRPMYWRNCHPFAYSANYSYSFGPIILRPHTAFAIGSCDPDLIEMGASEERDVVVTWLGNNNITSPISVNVSVSIGNAPITYTLDKTTGQLGQGGSFVTNLHIVTSSSVGNYEGDVYITIKDNAGVTVGKTFFKLKITNFVLSTDVIYVTMKPGDSERQPISIIYFKEISDILTPSVETAASIPTGLTISFDPTSINTTTQNSFDVILESTTTLEIGEYRININVTGGFSGSRLMTVVIRVVNYDLVCYESTKHISRITSDVTYTITVIPREGYTGQITVTSITDDDNITYSLNPQNPITIGPGETTFDITYSFNTQWNGRRSFLVTVIDYFNTPPNKALPPAEISVVVERGKFNIWIEQEYSVLLAGGTGTLRVYIENYTNDNLDVDFTILDMPYGWTKCFDYNEVTVVGRDTTSVLFQFKTLQTNTGGLYNIQISATDSTETDTCNYTAKIQNFQISVNTDSSVPVNGGDSKLISIFVQSLYGFDGYVALYIQIDPTVPWIECTFQPQIVKCKPDGIVTSSVLINLDAGFPLNAPNISITITGKSLESDVEKICEPVALLNCIRPIDKNSIRLSSPNITNTVITSFSIHPAASDAATGIVFECQPFKLIRQLKQNIQAEPIESFGTFIPYLAMNTFPDCVLHFENIEVLYPWAMGGCYGNNFKYSSYKSEIAIKWDVEQDIPTLFDQYGYCENRDTSLKIITTDHAKKAIGMPSPSTIDPKYIDAVWSKTYSSEDEPDRPCNNNVCIPDLRVFAFNIDKTIDSFDEFPPLQPGTTIILPLRANFLLKCVDGNGVSYERKSQLTRYCEITYEKPLPNHSQGGEKLTDKWFVGDNHIHSANSVVRLSAPNVDSESTNEGCPDHCGCVEEDEQHIGRIPLAAGPSVTQRAEECRELSYDFTYIADHSTGDGGGLDTVEDAWNKAVTPRIPSPNECNPIQNCPSGACVCTRNEKYWDAFGTGKDVVLIGKGSQINSQEVANRSYETSPPDKSCNRYHCTGRIVSNYHKEYIPNFLNNKLQLLMAANVVQQTVDYKYTSSILAHMHEEHCQTLMLEDETYPLTKEVSANDQYPGVHGFPWDYPGCVQSCDPWADWPNDPPQNPLYNHPPTPPFGMRHKTAAITGPTNDFGYDGFELMYQGYDNTSGPNFKTYERWKREIGEELPSVFANHPLTNTTKIEWTNDGPPTQFCRDIWHPFGVSASNVLRWWMGPWNRYYGHLMSYINCKEPNRYKNDIRGLNDTGLINPIGYYLRTGKVVASGKGSFATMWVGTKVGGQWVGPKEEPGECPEPAIKWAVRDSAFQPGDMISREDPCSTCCVYRDNDACSKLVYRIIMKSAWTGGTPVKADLWLHTPSNPLGTKIKEYTKNDFKRTDLSDCDLSPNPNLPILDPDDYWYYKDDCIPAADLPSGENRMWCIRLEVTFKVPGYENEVVLCSPIYSK